ncbi:MAG TPA: hypothetical protein VHR46_05765 [Gaiella sp.]|nr:hypothetical protein [Gaiella sp.]
MGRRALAWALVTPVAAAGVLVTHALAYCLTRTPTGAVHGYLDHAPQVVAVVASVALLGLAVQDRSLSRASSRWFAPLAPLGFAVQEHLEGLAHSGHVPWLLTTPSFLLGLALQVPVAFLCVLVVRRITGTVTGVRPRSPSAGAAWLPLTARPLLARGTSGPLRPSGRGPPRRLAT